MAQVFNDYLPKENKIPLEEVMTKITIVFSVLIIGLSFLGVGCVMSPLDQSTSCASSFTIWGYSSNSNSTVTFYAYNHWYLRWDSVGSATSSSTATEFCPEADMYYFSGSATGVGGDAYYHDCAGDSGQCREFMVYDGTRYITTFESGGSNCMSYRVTELEETCVEAAGVCASPNSPEFQLICPAK
ncbi:hypothetical protein ACFL2F_04500 [Myxococcota bacterium]